MWVMNPTTKSYAIQIEVSEVGRVINLSCINLFLAQGLRYLFVS